MEPVAVDVILRGGYPQYFTQGRSWRVDGVDPAGELKILDAEGQVIALIAKGWEAVGYRYAAFDVGPPKAKSAVASTLEKVERALRLRVLVHAD